MRGRCIVSPLSSWRRSFSSFWWSGFGGGFSFRCSRLSSLALFFLGFLVFFLLIALSPFLLSSLSLLVFIFRMFPLPFPLLSVLFCIFLFLSGFLLFPFGRGFLFFSFRPFLLLFLAGFWLPFLRCLLLFLGSALLVGFLFLFVLLFIGDLPFPFLFLSNSLLGRGLLFADAGICCCLEALDAMSIPLLDLAMIELEGSSLVGSFWVCLLQLMSAMHVSASYKGTCSVTISLRPNFVWGINSTISDLISWGVWAIAHRGRAKANTWCSLPLPCWSWGLLLHVHYFLDAQDLHLSSLLGSWKVTHAWNEGWACQVTPRPWNPLYIWQASNSLPLGDGGGWRGSGLNPSVSLEVEREAGGLLCRESPEDGGRTAFLRGVAEGATSLGDASSFPCRLCLRTGAGLALILKWGTEGVFSLASLSFHRSWSRYFSSKGRRRVAVTFSPKVIVTPQHAKGVVDRTRCLYLCNGALKKSILAVTRQLSSRRPKLEHGIQYIHPGISIITAFTNDGF